MTVTDAEARTLAPRVVFVDAENRISGVSGDPADALPGDIDSLRGDAVVEHRADRGADRQKRAATPSTFAARTE